MNVAKALTAMAAGLLLVTGGVVAVATPAQASLVYNMMLCEPDTGWCFQTNPPYNPNFKHECQWDYKLNGNNLHSGMWYTGCDVWWSEISARPLRRPALDAAVAIPANALLGFSGGTGGLTDVHAVSDIAIIY